MKPLTKEDLVDGLVLLTVMVSYSEENKAIIPVVGEQRVRKSANITPAENCDFILSGSSCHSDHVFEIGGVDGAIGADTIRFCLGTWRKCSISCYCLPENKSEVVRALKQKMAQEMEIVSNKLSQRATDMRKICKENKDEY